MSRRLITLLAAAVILTCLIVRSCSRAPAPRPPYDVNDSVFYKIEFVNIPAARARVVRREMRSLLRPGCRMAFIKAKLRDPLEVITVDGVVIRPSLDLHDYSAKALGLVSDETRRAYWEEFSYCRSQAGTVSVWLYGVRRTTDDRARIFLHDTAFMGESFVFSRLSLHDVIVHEFIHASGQPPTRGWFSVDDLAGFEYYGEIMEACR